MISPGTPADWLQASFLAGLLGTFALSMRRALAAEADVLDDKGDMNRDARRNAA
jgi:hypothetical protein